MKSIFKIKHLAAAAVFAALALSGCVKDNGNYDYTELPSMKIAAFTVNANGSDISIGKENQVYVNKNAQVTVTPEYDLDASLQPEYSWILIPHPNPDEIPGTVISTDPVLEYRFAEKPGLYDLVLQVNSNRKDQEFKEFLMIRLNIESINGIAVLHKDAAGNGDISVFKTAETDANLKGNDLVYNKNVYSSINGKTVRNPTTLTFDYDLANRFHLGYEGGVQYLDVEMKDQGTALSDLFYFETDLQEGFTPTEDVVNFKWTFSFMVAGGKLYGRSTNPYYENDGQYIRLGSIVEGEEVTGYKTYKDLIVLNDDNYSQHVIFNEDSKGFELLGQGCGGYMWGMDMTAQPTAINSLGGSVDIARTNREALSYGKASATLYAVMKDAANRISVVNFTYPNEEGNSQCMGEQDITGLEGVGENTIWRVGIKGDYIFYSDGTRLYLYNAKNNTSEVQDIRLESGETIVRLDIFKDNTMKGYEMAPGVNDGSLLFVTTRRADDYAIRQVKFNSLSGRVDNLNIKIVEGFGEVCDIVHVAR